jgi:hypothetical protein
VRFKGKKALIPRTFCRSIPIYLERPNNKPTNSTIGKALVRKGASRHHRSLLYPLPINEHQHRSSANRFRAPLIKPRGRFEIA